MVMALLPITDGLLLASVLAYCGDPDFRHERLTFLWILLAVPLLVKSYGFFGLYESQRVKGLSGVLRTVLATNLTAGLILAVLLKVASPAPPFLLLFKFIGISAAAILAERWTLYIALRLARRKGYDARNVCVIGEWERGREMAARFARHAEWGLRVVCVGEGTPETRRFRAYPGGWPIEGNLQDVLLTHVIDEVLVCVAPEDLPREMPVFHLCDEYGLQVRVVLDTSRHAIKDLSLQDLCGEVSLAVGRQRGSEWSLFAKRAIDVILAALALIVLGPLLALIAVILKLSSPGPVIFRQRRMGLHGRIFTMYKFRTMVDGAEAMLQSVAHRNIVGGPIFKDPADPRITNFGRILRRFSLDESPQLINVLRGDMSLVGPRPLPLHEANAISGEARRRLSMRPGLTCLWQINGRSHVEYTTWMKYDLQYVDGWSLWMDAKVLFRTIPAVLTGKGAC
jgi:exopolysaccharide biosynthesis polyprenyl glycosylphosphotransferase